MKLPWVSRSALEMALLAIQSEKEHNERLERALTDVTVKCQADQQFSNECYVGLLDQFTKLRIAGAVEPVVYTAPVPRPVDELEVLIGQESGGDVRKRAFMLKQLRKDRASGMTDDEITRRILNGQSVEDGVPV